MIGKQQGEEAEWRKMNEGNYQIGILWS